MKAMCKSFMRRTVSGISALVLASAFNAHVQAQTTSLDWLSLVAELARLESIDDQKTILSLVKKRQISVETRVDNDYWLIANLKSDSQPDIDSTLTFYRSNVEKRLIARIEIRRNGRSFMEPCISEADLKAIFGAVELQLALPPAPEKPLANGVDADWFRKNAVRAISAYAAYVPNENRRQVVVVNFGVFPCATDFLIQTYQPQVK